ncbi:hypothetical protein M3Y97_00163500 [Aphelenchoides bicaudatus]|nr:hypothetical protein M3Y97_00163500 [Aphelenchoides bicaudatus]
MTTQQNYQVTGEQIRDECMALLSNYRPGFEDPVQPERSEILENWSFEAALNRAHALADERLQELKRVLRADREMAKQSNMQAVSEFFDQVASGRYKRKFTAHGTSKRKYAQRKKSGEPTKKRATRGRKQKEESEMQQDDFYDQ